MDDEVRVDVISDTHNRVSRDLLDHLQGADLIVSAGDMCSLADYQALQEVAPVYMCLGNNDYPGEYGPSVGPYTTFTYAGLTWQVSHYRENLAPEGFDISIFGHTHKPVVLQDPASGALSMNPGSPVYPRSVMGPAMGRILIKGGKILAAEIIQL